MKPLSPRARELLLDYRREQKLPSALRATMLQRVEQRLQESASPESGSRSGTEPPARTTPPARVGPGSAARPGSRLTLLGTAGVLLIAAGATLFAARTSQEPPATPEKPPPAFLPPLVAQNDAAYETRVQPGRSASRPALPALQSEPTRRVRRAKATASGAKSEARTQEQELAPEPRNAAPRTVTAVAPNHSAPAENDMAQAETAASGTRVQEPSRAGDESEPLFDDEVMLLRDANEHLRRDQPLRALSALAEHARRFPRGELAALRIAVRIQALCALGKQRQAADEAESFLRAHPGSPYAPRVRSGCSPADASQ